MKFTEKLLLDNYSGISRCGEFISEVRNDKGIKHEVYWRYGYSDDISFYGVDDRDDAEEIAIEVTPFKHTGCNVPKRCMNREKYNEAMSDYAKWAEDVENGRV